MCKWRINICAGCEQSQPVSVNTIAEKLAMCFRCELHLAAEIYLSKFRELSIQRVSTEDKLSVLLKRSPIAEALFSVEPTGNWHEHLAACRAQWKEMSDDEKQQFVSEASRLRLERRAKLEALSDDERIALKNASEAIRKKKEKKKLIYALGRPKKPVHSSFLYFAQTVTVEGSSSEKLKLAAQKWKSMTEAEKLPFRERAKAAHKKYKAALAAWQNKLITTTGQSVANLLASMSMEKEKKKPTTKSAPKIRASTTESALEQLAVKYGKPIEPPLSVFLLFKSTLPLMENKKERSKIAVQKWEQMSESDKKLFYDATAAALQKYKAELAQWRQKMIENGFEALLMQFEAGSSENYSAT